MTKPIFNICSSVGIAILMCAAGCSSILTPVGRNKPLCNPAEDPLSPYCISPNSVEKATKGPLPPTVFDRNTDMNEINRIYGIDAKEPAAPIPLMANNKNVYSASTAQPNSNSKPLEGAPVREGPVIQRVWIQKYVTADDTLVQDSYVFKEVQPTRWAGVDNTSGPSVSRSSARSKEIYPHKPESATSMRGGGPIQTSPAPSAPPEKESSSNENQSESSASNGSAVFGRSNPN